MANIRVGFGTIIAETGIPVAVADGAEVNAWFNEYGHQINPSYDLAQNADLVSEVAPWGMMRMKNVWAQLTTAVPTYTAAVDVSVYHHLVFQIVVAAINTSVDVQAQGSLDNTSWFNLDDAGVDTQYVVNGTYMMHKDNFVANYVRFGAMAEVGGAAVTVDVVLFAGN
jgi:hypothetical protein